MSLPLPCRTERYKDRRVRPQPRRDILQLPRTSDGKVSGKDVQRETGVTDRTAWRTSTLMRLLSFDESSNFQSAITQAQWRERCCVRSVDLSAHDTKRDCKNFYLSFPHEVRLVSFFLKNSGHFADLQGRRNLYPYHPLTPGGDCHATRRARQLMCERTDLDGFGFL
jgi:hypothetical protein